MIHFYRLRLGYTINIKHTATVKEIGADYVVFTIGSTAFDITVKTGQTQVVTIDGQRVLNVTLNSVNGALVNATFAQMHIPGQATATVDSTP